MTEAVIAVPRPSPMREGFEKEVRKYDDLRFTTDFAYCIHDGKS
ncbi:MAG: hypothetical protein R3A47_01475 [Polyangiales bacterium]